MIPRPQHGPQVQQARLGYGSPPRAAGTANTIRRPNPPPPNRYEQRAVVLDRWGRASLAGNETDRAVVSAPDPSSGSSSGFLCAAAGFLLAAMFAGRGS